MRIAPAAGVTVLAVAIPQLKTEFSAATGALDATAAIYALVYAVLSLYAGRLGDRIGALRTLFYGAALFVLGSVVVAAAGSVPQLGAGRVLQGIGAAGIAPSVYHLLKLVSSRNTLSLVLAIQASVIAVGVAAGPLLAAWFVQYSSWRLAFLVLLVFVIVPLIVVGRMRPAEEIRSVLPAQRLIVPGTTRWLIAIALVQGSFVGGFYAQQWFLQETLGISPTVGGAVLIPTVAAFVIGTVVGTRLAARSNDLRTSILGFVGSAAAFLLLALAVDQEVESAVIACDLVAGFFIGIATPRMHHLILTNVPSAQVGAASGGIVFATHSGEGLGIIVFAGLASVASDTLSALAISATMLAMGVALLRSPRPAKRGPRKR
jgi:predicted MFS family arabinose efflux permease